MEKKIRGTWVAGVLTAVAAVAVAAVAAGVLFFPAAPAYAMTPALSLSTSGGTTVQVTVNGDPNASVALYYYAAGAAGIQSAVLGTTNANGYFSAPVTASSYGILAGNAVYVVVNGQQSSSQSWPAPTGTPTLSQASVTVGLGQKITVYSQGSSAPVYLASNSNPSAAAVQANGTQVTVTANQTGSTNASICYTGTAASCANLYVVVTATGALSFSQNNFTIPVGQSTAVTVTGGSGTYSVTNNSNPAVAAAVLSGSVVTVTPATMGTTNVTVCDTAGNCGTIYATVGSGTGTGTIYFSTPNPSLTLGQITTVTAYGGSNYYVTGNSNPSVASQTLSGSTLTISGLANGTTAINVCSASNGCATLTVTVGGSTSGTVSFGVTNPTVIVGQSTNIALTGNSSFYLSSNSNANIVTPSVNGMTLSLYGVNPGTSSVVLCATGSGACGTLSVTVVAASGGTAGSGSAAGTGTASNAALLSAIQSMQTQLAQLVTQIQTMASTLTQAAANLTGSSGGTAASGTGAGSAASSGSATTSTVFTGFLSVGSQNAQVAALQQYLAKKGFYNGAVTGYYGSLTASAVKSYQAAHGINAAGYVGPSTRAALNAGE